MTYAAPIATQSAICYTIAESHLGLGEFPGAKHNPKILEMFEAIGHGWVQDDETAWCAAFVGWVLLQANVRGTGKLNARSYMKWGEEVSIQEACPGDVAVLWREDPNSWKGHVAFVDSIKGGYIYLLGGNQGNEVSNRPYPIDRVLSIRRAKTPRQSITQSKAVRTSATDFTLKCVGGAAVIPQLPENTQLLAIGILGISLILTIYLARDRIKKWIEESVQ